VSRQAGEYQCLAALNFPENLDQRKLILSSFPVLPEIGRPSGNGGLMNRDTFPGMFLHARTFTTWSSPGRTTC
jgi:hypothetical protein